MHATGSLRVLAGIRYQALRPSSKVSHIRGVVERLNRIFREEFWCSDDEVDPETMKFHPERWIKVYNRKRPHSSLGRGALGKAERCWISWVSRMM
ncbi:integrase core domain-containing protein [Candidatus Caldatribacterium saccharofermentans]|uniref:integrase core domain-containing protein n=1 Tax=Candidatus Caldatribacterium saccharofermentans TaxID=1454753 RepID=UPI003D03CFA2